MSVQSVQTKTVMDTRLTHDGYLDVVAGSHGVDEAAVGHRGLELKEDVARVTHVEPRQVDGRVGLPEGHGVVVYICGERSG